MSLRGSSPTVREGTAVGDYVLPDGPGYFTEISTSSEIRCLAGLFTGC